MDVYKSNEGCDMTTQKRVRRSAPAARTAVLDAAEHRLREHGLEGLAIQDVAADAGMSHATLLHHFGSSDGMRGALIERMATNLLGEVTQLLQRADVARHSDEFYIHLFAALSGGGHAKLIGWQHLTGRDAPSMSGETRALFRQVLDGLRVRLMSFGRDAAAAEREARFIVLLVVSSALGFGIGRAPFLDDVGLTDTSDTEFARWMGRVVSSVIRREPFA
jgi:AcrR family transcriptional regulator